MKGILIKIPCFVLSGIVIAVVLYLTLVPKPLPDNDIHWFEHTDKVVHGVMMMGVYLALTIDVIKRKRQPVGLSSSYRILFLAAVIVLGGIIELLQGGMGLGRGCDLYDFIADAIGAYAGYLIAIRYSSGFAAWLFGS